MSPPSIRPRPAHSRSAQGIADRIPLALPDQGDGRQGPTASCTPSRRSPSSSIRASTPRRWSCATARQGQLPGRHHHRHGHQPRAARRPVPGAVLAPDGQGRSLSMQHPKVLGPGGLPAHLPGDAGLHRRPRADTPDELWLCEHPPVFTQGLAGKADHVLAPGDIPVVQTNRGGQVTFHGPGQVVAYPLIDLRRAGYFVKEYVYRHRGGGAAHAVGVRGDRPPRGGRAGHLRAPGRPVLARGLPGPMPVPGRPLPRPRQDRRAGHQGEPPLHLPRRGAERRHGPGTLLAHQPLRLCRAGNGRPFYNRGHHTWNEAAGVLGQKLRACWPPKDPMSSIPSSARRSPSTATRPPPSRRPRPSCRASR
jgi:hypothetical protein